MLYVMLIVFKKDVFLSMPTCKQDGEIVLFTQQTVQKKLRLPGENSFPQHTIQ